MNKYFEKCYHVCIVLLYSLSVKSETGFRTKTCPPRVGMFELFSVTQNNTVYVWQKSKNICDLYAIVGLFNNGCSVIIIISMWHSLDTIKKELLFDNRSSAQNRVIETNDLL